MCRALQHRRSNVANEQAANSHAQVHARVESAPLQVQPAQHARAYDGGGVLKRVKRGRDAREQQRGGAECAGHRGNVACRRRLHERGLAARDEAERHHSNSQREVGNLPRKLAGGRLAAGSVDEKRPRQRAADANGSQARLSSSAVRLLLASLRLVGLHGSRARCLCALNPLFCHAAPLFPACFRRHHSMLK